MLTQKYEMSTERTKKKKDVILNTKPTLCSERAVLYTESFKETEGKPSIIRNAMAFEKYISTMPISILDDELIVMNMASRPQAAPIFVEYGADWLLEELDTIPTRVADPFDISEEDKARLREVLPYWHGKTYQEYIREYFPDEVRAANEMTILIPDHLFTGGDGHFTAGYEMVIKRGLNDIIREAEEELAKLDVADPDHYDKSLFLKSVIIADKAAIRLAKRYSALASEMAAKEKDAKRKAELEKIADVCDRVPAEPARDFWEALQSEVFTIFLIQMEANGHSVNIGRVDQYVYPYFKKDMDEGNLTRAQALELVELWWLKHTELIKVIHKDNAVFFRGYQTFNQITIGGQTLDGKDATNELSYLLLEATGNTRTPRPSASVRIHKNTPDDFLMKALEINEANGGGMPALYNDEVALPAIMRDFPNVNESEALNWDVVGCVEIGLMGKSTSGSTYFSFWNAPKVLEMAMYGGKDPFTGRELGPKTGGMLSWKSFDDMMKDMRTHQDYYNKLYSAMFSTMNYTRRLNWQLPFVSSTFDGTLKRGKSHINGGIQSMPGSSPGMVGIANLGNSLAAIKKLVFDEKTLTMEQLKHALETNFEDMSTDPTGPEIQQLCLNVPKYGNDDDYVDDIIADVTSFQSDSLRDTKTIFGSHCISALLPVSGHVPFGGVVNATPDGRKAGTPLAEGCSPSQGTDVEGWTAAINSVSKIDHTKHSGGTLYNVKIDPKAVSTQAGMKKWADAVRTFFKRGGFHVQFNVVGRDTLLAAQERPQDYKDLLVRVAGYSAFFVMCDRALQDDIIARTEQMV